MLSKNEITTYEELKEYEEKLEDNITDLSTKRELYWKKVNRLKDNEKKQNLINSIEEISNEIFNLRKELKLCLGVEERTPIIKEKIKEVDKIGKERENE